MGKSTLFNALSDAGAEAANFPFCTIEPNVGVVTVPDLRMDKLSELVNPQKVVPTTMEFVDIAGLVKGASKGEGLGNQFLGNIRNVDAIIHVIRCFEDENVTHVDGSIDPVRDKEIIDTELQLKDLESIEKKIQKYEKLVKSNDKEAAKGLHVLGVFKKHLESGQSARTTPVEVEDKRFVEDLSLLTDKRILYVCNVDESSALAGNKFVEALKVAVRGEPAEVLIISASIESEILQLEDEADRKAFLHDLGLKQSGLDRLIAASYKLLKLNTYFTAGPKEVRAWTITEGTKAPQAAGVIHSDFERGFIRAEVIKFADYANLGSEAACKESGKMKVEGKEYVVKDGDVVFFRFNV